MASFGGTRLRRGMVSSWLVGAAVLSVGVSTAAYSVPQAATAAQPGGSVAAAPIPHGATLLPTGRFVRPAGRQYDLGDF